MNGHGWVDIVTIMTNKCINKGLIDNDVIATESTSIILYLQLSFPVINGTATCDTDRHGGGMHNAPKYNIRKCQARGSTAAASSFKAQHCL